MSRLEFDTGALPALVARPRGDIDMAVTPELKDELVAGVGEHGANCLVVDLGAVDYIDSSGIELLFRLHGALSRGLGRADRRRPARLQRRAPARDGRAQRHRGDPGLARGSAADLRRSRAALSDRVPS